MRILFITHSFNSLTQRLYMELTRRGHEVSVELDVNDDVTREAVELFKPDLIVAPFLKRAVPEDIWKNHVCLIVHPGPKGDRGPSSLDWAVQDGADEWGVTVLQAAEEMDAGDIWATHRFPMRDGSKGSLYRNEVTRAAVQGVLEAVENFTKPGFKPMPLTDLSGWRDLVKQDQRTIDWAADTTQTVLRKIRAADGFPGVRDTVLGLECFLFDAHPDEILNGPPGEVIAQRHGAICRATVDGAVWITHLKERNEDERTFKLPAAMVLKDRLDGIPEASANHAGITWRDIWYEREGEIGYLYFPFYNGAMSTLQCQRLAEAVRETREDDAKILVLMGGHDFWSNGIHLNTIEAAASPADESWANINAMDDVCREILTLDGKLTIAAMHGNAGAGGVFLALCTDIVVAREGVIMNPHYKNMGNLYGSEYWTYVLPRRGGEAAKSVMTNRLPVGTDEAMEKGLVDTVLPGLPREFSDGVRQYARSMAEASTVDGEIAKKQERRAADEAQKPLEEYRREELDRMKLNFYGFDPSYHVARYNFVFRVPHSRTPLHLAKHRR